MLKSPFKLLLFGIFICCSAVFILSCDPGPTFPNEPEISFRSVQFKDMGNTVDSLIITINFQDGDGDLGLAGNEITFPYHQFDFVENSNGEKVKLGDEPDLPDYNVCDYVIDPDSKDTLLIEFNQRHYNIFVDFFIDYAGDGNFQEYDFKRANGINSCETYDGRFFPLKTSSKKRALQGELRYSMSGRAFQPIFRNYKVKIKVNIMDRAGHLSNDAESKVFTIDEITI